MLSRNSWRELILDLGSYLKGYPLIRICWARLKNGVVGLSIKILVYFMLIITLETVLKKVV
jgi:hypothetical protein